MAWLAASALSPSRSDGQEQAPYLSDQLPTPSHDPGRLTAFRWELLPTLFKPDPVVEQYRSTLLSGSFGQIPSPPSASKEHPRPEKRLSLRLNTKSSKSYRPQPKAAAEVTQEGSPTLGSNVDLDLDWTLSSNWLFRVHAAGAIATPAAITITEAPGQPSETTRRTPKQNDLYEPSIGSAVEAELRGTLGRFEVSARHTDVSEEFSDPTATKPKRPGSSSRLLLRRQAKGWRVLAQVESSEQGTGKRARERVDYRLETGFDLPLKLVSEWSYRATSEPGRFAETRSQLGLKRRFGKLHVALKRSTGEKKPGERSATHRRTKG